MNTFGYSTTPHFLFSSVFLFLSFFFASSSLQAQLNVDQTRELIRDVGNYTSGVSIDNRGYAKGDFNIYERRWYLNDPFWRTGQAIVALREGYKILEHPRFKLASERAAAWLKSQESKGWEGEGTLIGPTRKEKRREFVGTSDVMKGLPGLFAFWRYEGDTASRDMALRIVQYIYQRAYTEDEGCWYDYFDYQTGVPLTLEDPFMLAQRKEAVLHKIARPHVEGLAFLEAYRETGNATYKEAFLTQCERLVNTQKDGRWDYWSKLDRNAVGNENSYDLWYTEALLEAYQLTKEERYLDAVKAAADSYLAMREEDGTIYRQKQDEISGDSPAVDGFSVAFLGYVLAGLIEEGQVDYTAAMDQCAVWLYNNRYDIFHQNVNLRRAIKSQRELRRKGVATRTNEDIGSIFALKFLCAYYHVKFD